MGYHQDNLRELEDIRSMIKHMDPEQVDLERIRGFLGYVRWDLEVLASLRRPDTYTLQRLPEGMAKVTVSILVPDEDAEQLVQKLWAELDPPVSDEKPAAVPTPQEPSSTPRSPLE